MPNDLHTVPVTVFKGVSTAREKLFAEAGIHSVHDLLNYYPRAYENRGNVKEVFAAVDGETASFLLTVTTPLTNARLKSKTGRPLSVQRFAAADDTGTVRVTFFNRPFLKDTFKVGAKFRFYGVLERTPRGISLSSPEFEPYADEADLQPLVPIYPLVSGLTQKILSGCIKQALERYKDDITETLDAELLGRLNFPERYPALCALHFPDDTDALQKARRRFAFEELYEFKLRTAELGKKARAGKALRLHYPDMRAFTARLPFTLTHAQKLAIQDILKDMTAVASPEEEKMMQGRATAAYTRPARRLVQGDVGCGKTVVAAAAVYAAVQSGAQAALMAPTGILARQHYEELSVLLAAFGIKTVLLVGGMKAAEKRAALESLADGSAHFAVGTHALIEENVVFHNLALTVTDEQHRFGVLQRSALEHKSEHGLKPHTVVMSATPIPRTLAMILYCDLDISVIDELPKGRKLVETYAVGTGMRTRVYKFIAGEVSAGHQAYIVCPLAENDDTENLPDELASAREYAESLRNTPLAETRIAYIHGKMKPSEKDRIMTDFASHKIDVLVSTTVIEVGVNVPNATVMFIENAERFGLSQLHQLRGRVGRGSDKAYCILLSPLMKKEKKNDSPFAKRMEVLCRTSNGFVIAEKDLELRGPGEFFGTRQSGELAFRFADITDTALLKLANEEAEAKLKTKTENVRKDDSFGQ